VWCVCVVCCVYVLFGGGGTVKTKKQFSKAYCIITVKIEFALKR